MPSSSFGINDVVLLIRTLDTNPLGGVLLCIGGLVVVVGIYVCRRLPTQGFLRYQKRGKGKSTSRLKDVELEQETGTQASGR